MNFLFSLDMTSYVLNPLTPELNPYTQRCRTRFFYLEFHRAFRSYMREKPTNETIIHTFY
jgi:hypothetical protein